MFLLVYARLYGKCLKLALQGVAKNPWTLALPMALFAGFGLMSSLLAPLGIIGGFLIGFLNAAVLSCYLYFTAGTVAQQKMTLSELKKSFLVYFWSVIGLFFVLWIGRLLLGSVLPPQQGPKIMTALYLLSYIVLNPAPEIIYSKGTRGGIDTITTCIKFLQETWIEWFIPNLLIAGAAWLFVERGLMYIPFGIPYVLLKLLAGALFHIFMLYRGNLFQELDGSSHRQRMYRYRNAS